MLLVVFGSVFAVAGDNPNAGKTPKYIWIQTEQYQPGKEAAYMRTTQLFKEAMAPTEMYWLAGMPLAGNGNEVTYVMFPGSFADIDKIVATFEKAGAQMHQKNAALVEEGMAAVKKSHAILGEFQPELSLVSEQHNPAQVTRWRVTKFNIRPGTSEEFSGLIKEAREMHAKANDGVHFFVYRILYGDDPGFTIVMPLKTLADLDQPPSEAFKALFTPLVKEHFYSVVRKTVVSETTNLYAVQPQLSNPPKSYVAANPDFWTVKEPPPVTAKAAKKPKKTAEAGPKIEPAVMKETGKK
jgi:hypothetical protein